MVESPGQIVTVNAIVKSLQSVNGLVSESSSPQVGLLANCPVNLETADSVRCYAEEIVS